MRFTNYLFHFFLAWYAITIVFVSFNWAPSSLVWASSIFVMLTGALAVCYFIQVFDWQVGILLSIGIFCWTFLIEYLGMSNQFLFGAFYYTENLSFHLFGVPVAVGFAWLTVIASGHAITSFMKTRNFPLRAMLASLIALLFDLMLDPVAFVAKEYWIWENGGVFYDIPWTNFFGWWFLAFLIHLVIYFFLPYPKEDYIWQNRMALIFLLMMLLLLIIGLVHALYTAVAIAAFGTLIIVYLLRKRLSYI